jgi:hypothetical protein
MQVVATIEKLEASWPAIDGTGMPLGVPPALPTVKARVVPPTPMPPKSWFGGEITMLAGAGAGTARRLQRRFLLWCFRLHFFAEVAPGECEAAEPGSGVAIAKRHPTKANTATRLISLPLGLIDPLIRRTPSGGLQILHRGPSGLARVD